MILGMFRKILILISLAIFSNFAFAQEKENPVENSVAEETSVAEGKSEIRQDLVVSEIRFSGLKRTREGFLQKKYEKYTGRTVAETNLKALETELQAEGLFDKIQVSLCQDGENARIDVSFEEKISFIPLPFALVSSGGFSAGLFVIDMNAFGVKDTFMVGGLYSPDALTGMLMFSKPAGENFRPGFSVFASTSKNDAEVYNIENDSVLEYENLSFGARISLSEKFGRYNTASVSIGFSSVDTDSDGAQAVQLDSAKIGTVGLSWGISASEWNGVFLSNSGISASGSAARCFDLEGDSPLSKWILGFSSNIGFQKSLFWDRLRFCGHFSSAFFSCESGKSAHISEYEDRSAAGITILPSNFRTDRIFGGSAGFEVALTKFRFGLLSLYGNWEALWADEFSFSETDFDLDSLEFCHGPNGGMRLYLSKIAFPALAFGLSYNISQKYWQYSLALGISM